jgi:hypothetical protein
MANKQKKWRKNNTSMTEKERGVLSLRWGSSNGSQKWGAIVRVRDGDPVGEQEKVHSSQEERENAIRAK